MRIQAGLLVLQAAASLSLRIILTNDDGWAEGYLRALFDVLDYSGHDLVLSAPADDMSGTGPTDRAPRPRQQPCKYDSCEPDYFPTGFNLSDPRLNWVNSYSVTAMKYGIETFCDALWEGETPEIAIAGPNVGPTTFHGIPISGTVAAAAHAANSGIPAIALSVHGGDSSPWHEAPPLGAYAFGELTDLLISKLATKSFPPSLPQDTFLNVNFPKSGEGCSKEEDYSFVYSRIDPAHDGDDVAWCGSNTLPTESQVLNADGCFVSVSLADSRTKRTPKDPRQKHVLEKLRSLFVCLRDDEE